MTEDLLQYVWKSRLLSPQKQLTTTKDVPISVIDTGEHNHHEGPDFLHAKVKIGDVLWSGHIEIDLQSSLWQSHKHAGNPQYKNVILHVVWEDNATSIASLPVLQLKHHISPTFLEVYMEFIRRKGLPCQSQLESIDKSVWEEWITYLLKERLHQKSTQFLGMVKEAGGNWEQAFWELLAYYMGSTQNAHAFQEIARSLPVSLLYKERKSLAHIESLLLGQAGLLGKPKGDYAASLRTNYAHLANKYQLQPTYTALKYLRMRPSNFPDIRLAQLAHLVYSTDRLVDIFTSPQTLDHYFDNLADTVSPYWRSHYRLAGNATTSLHSAVLGKQMRLSIDINVRMVAMYAYALENKRDELASYVYFRLSKLPCEQNRIVSFWKSLSLPMQLASSKESQALLHLKKTYCEPKHCLRCAIGCQLLEKHNG